MAANPDLQREPEDVRGPIRAIIDEARRALEGVNLEKNRERTPHAVWAHVDGDTRRGVHYEIGPRGPYFRIEHKTYPTKTTGSIFVQAEFNLSGTDMWTAGKVTSSPLQGSATMQQRLAAK